jgi:hypothetical protein
VEDTPGEEGGDVVVATTIPASNLTPEGSEAPKADGSEGTNLGAESNGSAPTGDAQAPQGADAQTGGTL